MRKRSIILKDIKENSDKVILSKSLLIEYFDSIIKFTKMVRGKDFKRKFDSDDVNLCLDFIKLTMETEFHIVLRE